MIRKIELIAGILILAAIVLITGFGLCSGSSELNSQSDKVNIDIETVTDSFDSNHMAFEHYGFCEGGPWNLFSNIEGEIYTYEWDTVGNSPYSISCIRSSWKDGVHEYQLLEEKAVRNAYGSGEEVSYTSSDNEGRLFLNGWDGSFYALDSFGELIKKIDVVGHMKDFSDDAEYLSICSHFVQGDFVYFVMCEDNYSQQVYSLQKFNWKTGVFISAFQLYDIVPDKFINGVVYGYGDDCILGIDIYGNQVLSLKVPSGNKTYVSYFSMKYNKREFTIYGNSVYYTDSEGIYFSENGSEELKRIFAKNEVEFLEEAYSLVDMAVNSKGDLYVLAIAGADEEWPTDLFIINQ